MNVRGNVSLKTVLAIACILLGAFLPLLSMATTVQAVLPPRPTATITPPDTPEVTGPDDRPHATPVPVIARLELSVDSARSDLMSVIQWVNKTGDWIDVEGWRGMVVDGHTVWWVEQKDFGKGPFRWVVYDATNDEVLAMTEPFLLPTQRQAIGYRLSVP